jgi:hypothetical protein
MTRAGWGAVTIASDGPIGKAYACRATTREKEDVAFVFFVPAAG